MKRLERQSNLELLRIICMVMVIFLHLLGHGGALENINIKSINFYISQYLESFSIVAVNTYIIISGYFAIDSEFSSVKLKKLYKQVLTYSILIPIFFVTIGYKDINLDLIINAALPITTQVWWFITLYIVLYILSPYINKLLKNLSRKEFTRFIFILTVIFVIWPSIRVKLVPIDTASGYSLYQFIYIYILGAYIKIFYSEKSCKKRYSILVYIICTIVLACFNIGVSIIANKNFYMYPYNFVLVVISSVALFLFFKELKVKSKLINKLAALTLGVYLLHDHPYVRDIIYDKLNYSLFFDSKLFIIYTILIVLVIYSVASLIEFIRQMIINKFTK